MLSARLRSTLTVLSILIGVAAVVELVAVGAGSRVAVQDSLARLGTSTVYVWPHQAGTGGAGSEQQNEIRRALGLPPPPANATDPRKPQLTWSDVAALQDPVAAPDVVAVAPSIGIWNVQAQYGSTSHSISMLLGTTPDYLPISGDTLAAGQGFTSADVATHARKCVLGPTVVADLTGAVPDSLVGRTIRLNDRPFLLSGILAAKGFTGQSDLDNRALCPATTVGDTLYGYAPPGQGPLNGIAVQASSPAAVPAAQPQISQILDARHHLSPVDADFVTYTAASLLTASSSTAKTLTILLAVVAGICLLVGGIGVMNTMLIAVTERTNEIGVRKAVGAGRGDILGQFLGEAAILSLIGGAIGAVAGIALSRLHVAGVHPVLAPWSIWSALAGTLCTGLFFGLYPARRAAALSPIEAVRRDGGQGSRAESVPGVVRRGIGRRRSSVVGGGVRRCSGRDARPDRAGCGRSRCCGRAASARVVGGLPDDDGLCRGCAVRYGADRGHALPDREVGAGGRPDLGVGGGRAERDGSRRGAGGGRSRCTGRGDRVDGHGVSGDRGDDATYSAAHPAGLSRTAGRATGASTATAAETPHAGSVDRVADHHGVGSQSLRRVRGGGVAHLDAFADGKVGLGGVDQLHETRRVAPTDRLLAGRTQDLQDVAVDRSDLAVDAGVPVARRVRGAGG